MREMGIIGGCALFLGLAAWALFRSGDTSAAPPAHAMEVATLKAEAAGARQEAHDAKAHLDKARADLQDALRKNEELSKKVADLEKRLAAQGKK